MLCKKCRTSVNPIDSDNASTGYTNNKNAACSYCGHALPQKTGFKLILSGIMSFLIMLTCGGYIYMNANGKLPPVGDEQPASETPTEYAELPNAHQQSSSQIPDLIRTEPPVLNNEKSFDDDSVWDLLKTVERSLSQYLYANDISSSFITRNGYFYNYENRSFLTIKDLIEAGFLDKMYENEDVLLMYLRPSDFRGYEEIDFGISSDLKVFTGYETTRGIAIYTEDTRGLIFREHFNNIIENYTITVSDIKTPVYGSVEFMGIVNSIKSNELDEIGYDVRYIRCDDQYAVIVFSHQPDPTVLYGYLLKRIADDFTVILRRFEQYGNDYISKINNVAVNINLDMLPPTPLNEFTLYGYEKFSFIVSDLLNLERISQSDMPVSYVCGTDDFFYMEFSSGKKYLGALTVSGWKVEQFTTRNEAMLKLESLTDTLPWMIMLAN